MNVDDARHPGTTRLSGGHGAPLEYHRGLLDDPLRMDAFERAIRALVRPGDVVLDLGCGSGVLAMLAARRGARVHAVESTPVAELARSLVADNGLEDRVTVHRADARTMAPVEPVDLVLSEFLGRFVVDDGMLPVVSAAAAWMKPAARFCPALVRMQLAPVGDFELRAVDLFDEGLYGLRLGGARVYALNYCYHVRLGPEAALAPPAEYARFAPPATPAQFDTALVFEVVRGGLLRGVAGWFDASLAPGVTLSTGLGSDTHWGQYLFPLPPVVVGAGDRLDLRLAGGWDESAGAFVWRWSGAVRRRAGEDVPFAYESDQKLGRRGRGGSGGP